MELGLPLIASLAILASSMGVFLELLLELGENAYEVYNRNKGEAFRQFISLIIEKLPLATARGHATALHERSISYRYSFELKKDLENDKIEVIFYEIPEIDLEKCHAKQEMTIRISKDSITRSKKILDRYINSINKTINN